jgi:HEAT repeat protein
VGALAQIGDARAVGPLIDAAQRGDPGFTARVARVVGDIGGAEAEGYLLTLASGHPDARVRRAAREALEAMAARRKTPAVAAGR